MTLEEDLSDAIDWLINKKYHSHLFKLPEEGKNSCAICGKSAKRIYAQRTLNSDELYT